MKVPGSDGSSDIAKRVQETTVGDRSVQRRSATDAGAPATGGLIGELAKSQGDTFTVSNLGVSIREELDPVKMAAERRAKIESLKEQIRNGTYAPPINDVARSVGEEISLEVLFGGDALKAG
jgi:hypothetical protein